MNGAELDLSRVDYWVNWLNRQFAAGKWRSYWGGRGYDFRDLVPFHEDPDPGRINLRASILLEEDYVNVFAEERKINIVVLGNLSPGMSFGSLQTKRERLALTVAILSWSAYWTKDIFRFVGYTAQEELDFPRMRDRSYPYRIYEAVLNFPWKEKGRGGLARAAETELPRQKSLVIIVSDLRSGLQGLRDTFDTIAFKHDVLPIVLWDPKEVELPEKPKIYPLFVEDLETGKSKFVLVTPSAKERFKKNAEEWGQRIIETCEEYGITPHFMMGAGEKDVERLIDIFLERRAVLQKR